MASHITATSTTMRSPLAPTIALLAFHSAAVSAEFFCSEIWGNSECIDSDALHSSQRLLTHASPAASRVPLLNDISHSRAVRLCASLCTWRVSSSSSSPCTRTHLLVSREHHNDNDLAVVRFASCVGWRPLPHTPFIIALTNFDPDRASSLFCRTLLSLFIDHPFDKSGSKLVG